MREARRLSEELVERDSEARQYYEELRDVGRLFQEAGQLDPPKELEEKILASLPHPARKKVRRNYLAAVRNAFRPTPTMRPPNTPIRSA